MTTPTAPGRRLILKMSVSVDGFVCGPSGEIDWIFRTMGDPEARDWIVDTISGAGAHMMGSRTYDDMAAFWPFSDTPIAPSMNNIPKIVFSKTGIKDGTQVDRTTRALKDANANRTGEEAAITPTAAVLKSWAEPTVVSGDLAKEVLRLKQQPGDYILAHGGARFGQSLVASGLIDEYRLVIHPVVLGKGQPLFCELRSPVDLRLVSATSFGSGVVATVYQPA